jgi:hypothetical protein
MVKNQLYDTIFLLSLYALFLGLKANAPDDDEDPVVKNQYKYLLRMVDKMKDELSYFYDPTSITSLVSGGVFPAINLIENGIIKFHFYAIFKTAFRKILEDVKSKNYESVTCIKIKKN